MTLDELRAKWEVRQVDAVRLGSLAPLAAVAADFLQDLRQLEGSAIGATVTPADAAASSGFHVETIHRMIRDGRLRNYGTQRRPRVALAECPRKATAPTRAEPVARSAESGASSSPNAIALDILASRRGRRRSTR